MENGDNGGGDEAMRILDKKNYSLELVKKPSKL
jgi:hypothetical protein